VAIGLQTMNMDDNLLLNDQVLGISATRWFGKFKWDALAGTLSSDFLRAEGFCAKRNGYCLKDCRQCRFGYGERNLTGAERLEYGFGERNVAGTMLSWVPSRAAVEAAQGGDDDFQPVDAGGSKAADYGPLEKIGVFVLDETRDHFAEYTYYYGALSTWRLPADIKLELEASFQNMADDHATAYMGALQRGFGWGGAGATEVRAGYLGGVAFDDDAHYAATYSRLCLGEVLALDTPDIPIVFGSVRHNFPWRGHPWLSVGYVDQPGGYHGEWDFQAGFKIGKHIKIGAVYSRVEDERLGHPTQLGAIHHSWTF
jgi:hypothetical protein